MHLNGEDCKLIRTASIVDKRIRKCCKTVVTKTNVSAIVSNTPKYCISLSHNAALEDVQVCKTVWQGNLPAS